MTRRKQSEWIDIDPGGALQTLETRGGIQLHHLGAVAGLEQIDSGHIEAQYASRSHGCALISHPFPEARNWLGFPC